MLLLDALLDILRQETEVQKKLLKQSQEKRDAIIKNEVAMITEIVKAEAHLIDEAGRLEAKRVEELEGLAKALNMPIEEITLSGLSAQASPRQKIQISALQNAMRQILEELTKLNDINRMLIDTQLEYINFTIDVTLRKDMFTNNYTCGGEVEDHKRTTAGLFDQEV